MSIINTIVLALTLTLSLNSTTTSVVSAVNWGTYGNGFGNGFGTPGMPGNSSATTTGNTNTATKRTSSHDVQYLEGGMKVTKSNVQTSTTTKSNTNTVEEKGNCCLVVIIIVVSLVVVIIVVVVVVVCVKKGKKDKGANTGTFSNSSNLYSNPNYNDQNHMNANYQPVATSEPMHHGPGASITVTTNQNDTNLMYNTHSHTNSHHQPGPGSYSSPVMHNHHGPAVPHQAPQPFQPYENQGGYISPNMRPNHY